MATVERTHPPASDYREAKRDLLELERVYDASIWYSGKAVRADDGRKTVAGDVPTRISVETHNADSSRFLIPVMKEHGLVITDFSCGKNGFRANLRFEGTVYDD